MDTNQIPEFIKPDLLPDNHTVTQKEKVRIDYTPEEITEMKAGYFEIGLHMANREKLVNSIKEMANSDMTRAQIIESIKSLADELPSIGDTGIKQLKSDLKRSMEVINQGYVIEEKLLYGFAHPDIRRMAFYLPDGRFHHDRPLKANEMQLSTVGAHGVVHLDTKTA